MSKSLKQIFRHLRLDSRFKYSDLFTSHMNKFNTIGKRLAFIRLEVMKLASQRELAVFFDVSKGSISKYEKDERLLPLKFYIILYNFYNINPNWLLLGEGSLTLNLDIDINSIAFKSIGDRFLHIRIEIAKISSQMEFSKILEIASTSVFLYENDKATTPTHVFLKFHIKYGVNFIWFLFGVGDKISITAHVK